MKKPPAIESTGLRRLVTVILFIVLLGAGWLFQAGAGLERTLFSEAYYHRIIGELDLGPRLHGLFLHTLVRDHPDLPAAESLLNRALAEAVDPAWLDEVAELAASDAAAFIGGERDRLTVAVDLRERKEVFKRALKEELKELSPPALEQLALPESLIEDFIDQLEFPDRLVLLDLSGAEVAESEAGEALADIRQTRLFLRYAPYLLFGAAALLSIWWTGLAGGLRWLGCAMLVSGFSYLAALGGARALLPERYAELLAGHALFNLIFPEGPAAVLSAVAGLTYELLADISLIYAAAGLPLLCAGLVLGLVRPAARRRKKEARR